VLLQRLERHLAALNEEIGPWGPLRLRMNAGFWTARDTTTLVELLDSVETGLRRGVCASEKIETQPKAILKCETL